MEKVIFLKYADEKDSNSLSYLQAKSLLKEVLSLDDETIENELPKDIPITYELIKIYFFLKKNPNYHFLWSYFLKVTEYMKINYNAANTQAELYEIKIKAGDETNDFQCFKGVLDICLGNNENQNGDLFCFELSLSCDNPEEAKPKLEKVFSNVKTILKNLSKKIFEIYDLFEIKVIAKEKKIDAQFLLKKPEIADTLAYSINYAQNLFKKFNGVKLDGSLNLQLKMSSEINFGLLLGQKFLEKHLFLKFPKGLKEIINKILYEEAEKLMLQKESFGSKYINRISYFCLLQSGNFSLDVKSPENLYLLFLQDKNNHIGESIEENLEEIIQSGPPFIRKFCETFSLFSGECSLIMVLPVDSFRLETKIMIPETLNSIIKKLLIKKN